MMRGSGRGVISGRCVSEYQVGTHIETVAQERIFKFECDLRQQMKSVRKT